VPEERRTPVVRAIERVAPATVNITTTSQVRGRANPFFPGDPVFEEFFRSFLDPRPRTVQSLGSGVIIDRQGRVLTNEHVLAGATQIQVTLADGRSFEGELIGADPETDLAVLRIADPEASLPVAPLGRSDDLLIGETVIAIGNPFGLHHTVTTGVLSAVSRSFRAGHSDYHGFLQTDTSINPGNSGGPLLNIAGEVIGINTAIFQDAQGIGFAIPIDRARRIVDDLIRYGEVVPVWLGLQLRPHRPEAAEPLAEIAHVFARSPAQAADLRVGDVLLELDRSRVQSPRSYYEILRGVTDGDHVRLVIVRDGARIERELRAETFPEVRADELARVLLGVSVAEAVRGHGLLVQNLDPGGPAARIGIRPGDLILRVDREPVPDLVAFRKAMTKLRGRERVLLVVQRGPAAYQVTLRLG
jgi:S1-C subfamily serine protease